MAMLKIFSQTRHLIDVTGCKSLSSLFNGSIYSVSHYGTVANKRHLLDTRDYVNSSISTARTNLNLLPSRYIYGSEALGIDKLEAMASRSQLYQSGKERYMERIQQYLDSGDTTSVVKDDLINLISLAETESHLDLIEKVAIITTNSEPQEKPWGSAVMRLYYKMNQLDRAINNMKDETKFGNFFYQRISFQIVMTMCFNAQRYQDVIELYHLSKEKLHSAEQRFPTHRALTVIVFATYSKMNTSEALEAAEKLYSEDPHNPYLKTRVVALLAHLAVNQNKPALALNLLSDAPNRNYISMRELKTLAMIKMKRYEDVLYHLRESVSDIKRDQTVLLQQTQQLIMNNQDEIEDGNIRQEVKDILVELEKNKLISTDDIETVVFKEIQGRRQFQNQDDTAYNRGGFRNNNYRDNYRDNNRENYRDSNRENYRDNYRDNNRENYRNNYRDNNRDNQGREPGQNSFKSSPYERRPNVRNYVD